MASHRIDWQETPPPGCRGGVLTVGNFDGVHRGHAALVAEVCRQARTVGVPAVALTFDPHPRDVLQPGQTHPLLTTAADRAQLLQELGTDQVVILRTTPDLLTLTAADFFQQVIRQCLQAVALVEGVNFCFGRHREGNTEVLARLCRNDVNQPPRNQARYSPPGFAAALPLTVIPQMVWEGREVSSSEVRQLLLRGEVDEAGRLLGRPYRLHGVVGTGQKRGQTLGFPTANLEKIPTLVPGDGVYAVRVLAAGSPWPGAANVGPNPTFGEQARKVEVHLIDFRGDLYGQPLTIDFAQRLRETRPFGSVAELVEQLRRDVEQARQVLSTPY